MKDIKGGKMLKGFSVENFKSFNKNQSISWVPSKYSRHKSHIYEKSGNKVLKGGLIFGANAGGKSNLIQAIEFAKNIVLNGTDFVDCEKNYFERNF